MRNFLNTIKKYNVDFVNVMKKIIMCIENTAIEDNQLLLNRQNEKYKI